MRPHPAAALRALVLFGVTAGPAVAQTTPPPAAAGTPAPIPVSSAMPSPVVTRPPAPLPPGLRARAHAVVTVTGPSTGTAPPRTLTFSIGLAVATRPNLVRVDVLSLKSDVAALPNLHFTAVLDRRANTVTLWNDAVKRYYLLTFLPQATPTPAPRGSPTPVPRAVSPLSRLDILAIAITMTGHTVTNGVPTTGLSFDLRVAKKGQAVPVHVTATTQIVDDSAWLPMTIDAVVRSRHSAGGGDLRVCNRRADARVAAIEPVRDPAGVYASELAVCHHPAWEMSALLQ
jgi:hypothetical protein